MSDIRRTMPPMMLDITEETFIDEVEFDQNFGLLPPPHIVIQVTLSSSLSYNVFIL